jgi:hypothetical protein
MHLLPGPLAHDRSEQQTHNLLVQGSTPWGPTINDDNIIDAEFTEIYDDRINPALAAAIYKYIGDIGQRPKPGSVVSTYC